MPWEHALPARAFGALVLLTALGLGAAPTWASDKEVAQRGWRMRLPDGFRTDGTRSEEDFEEHRYKRRLERGGTLVLTITSRSDDDESEARMEMELARAFDRIDGLLSLQDAQSETHDVRVGGATEAHQTLITAEDGRQHVLSARRGALVVTVTLAGPATASEELGAAWNRVLASLQLVDPGTSAVVWFLVAVGALALLAVGLTVARRRRETRAAVWEPASAAERFRAPPMAAAPPRPFEPQSLPSAALGGRAFPAGLSRADDGLPVFSAEDKAARGEEPPVLRPAAPQPRQAQSAVTAPEPVRPARTPNLTPPALRVKTDGPTRPQAG